VPARTTHSWRCQLVTGERRLSGHRRSRSARACALGSDRRPGCRALLGRSLPGHLLEARQGYSAGSLAASRVRLAEERLRLRQCLISYPVGVLWALTLFRSTPFTRALEQIDTPTLVIHGDSDQFTSSSSYAAWSAGLKPNFEVLACDDADHFWSAGTRPLRHALRAWLTKPSP
jgi:pimeloyl-ACP methyl ester carboxylesterase